MPYCDEKRVIFLHIPKTGGTTIKELFGIRQLDDPDPSIVPSPQHLTSRQLRERLGDGKFEAYYKFTFVRNPWARMVSDYFWRQQLPKKRPVLPFAEFVQNAQRIVESGSFYEQEFGDHFIPQTQYTVDVDEVFRFEAFEDGLRAVAVRLGLEIGPIPPKPGKPHDRYWTYYDEQSRATVFDTYRDEIEEFGYTFGAS
jgi:hypothetical protein